MQASRLIEYRDGYKYQLAETYRVFVDIRPDRHITASFMSLSPEGLLTIDAGYAWDGASGLLTIQTKNTMRGSLVHDALYQLMSEGLLDEKKHREAADREMMRILLEDGMSKFRAGYFYRAVRVFGQPHADPTSRKRIHIAP